MSVNSREEKQDRAVEDSFPASDPPANSGVTGPRATPRRPPSHRQAEDGRPKSTPTDDRHATETACQDETPPHGQ